MLLLLLSGCITMYHKVETGWVSGSGDDGTADHGFLLAYSLVLAPDKDHYSFGWGAQGFGLNNPQNTASFDIVGLMDVWTDPLYDSPVGLHLQSSLMQNLLIPMPNGVSFRAGPYVDLGEDNVRLSLDALGQASIFTRPMLHWGSTVGIRWEAHLLTER